MFKYLLIEYDPLNEDADCIDCFANRVEAAKELRARREHESFYSYWIEVKYVSWQTRLELQDTEREMSFRRDVWAGDIEDNDLPF